MLIKKKLSNLNVLEAVDTGDTVTNAQHATGLCSSGVPNYKLCPCIKFESGSGSAFDLVL
jgi:hypothetical protein